MGSTHAGGDHRPARNDDEVVAVERDHDIGNRARGNEAGHTVDGGVQRERREPFTRRDRRHVAGPPGAGERSRRDGALDQRDGPEVTPVLPGDERQVEEGAATAAGLRRDRQRGRARLDQAGPEPGIVTGRLGRPHPIG